MANNLFQKIFRIFFKKNIHSEQNSVRLQSEYLFSRKLGRVLNCEIFLPASFRADKNQEYPLLIMNDAQDMEAVKLRISLERLYQQKSLPHLIVLAVFPFDRMHEYGTRNFADYAGRGKFSKAYQDAVIQELLPFIQQKYKLMFCKENSAIAGFSLGGLSAFDLAWHHPEIFSKVGVFSGSFWWRSKPFKEEDPDADRIIHNYIEAATNLPDLKYWLQTGTNDETEDRNKNGVIDSIDDTKDLIAILKNKGCLHSDIVYREVEDGEHNPQTWGAVMPEFLLWCFGKTTQQS